MPNLTTYVAFLRGINVGGNKMIKMEELAKSFASLGFKNVKTVLATGNIIFDATAAKPETLTATIEKKLRTAFGHEIDVILDTLEELKELITSDPFRNISITPDTRLYVTFLKEKPKNGLKIPYESPQKNFRILKLSGNALISVLILMPELRTTDAMNIIEKEFGKKVTTRNWNTIVKIGSVR